tara:strand:- start:345 stop:1172 length:828 start_codon:yes stop_codon:yes gene_type:complete
MTKPTETTLDKVVPNPPARQPKRVRDQGPGQPVIEFVVNSAVERSEEINKKYNDAEPMTFAAVGMHRLTSKQLDKRTSSNFAAFIMQGKEESVVYEYIAYLPPYNDYITSVDLREVTKYLKLKSAVGIMNAEPERVEPEEIRVLRKEFPTSDERTKALLSLQDKLFEGLYRMYSTDKASGDIILSAGKLVTKDYGFLVPGNKTKIASPAIADIQATVAQLKSLLEAEKARKEYRVEADRQLKEYEDAQLKNILSGEDKDKVKLRDLLLDTPGGFS